MNRPFSENKKKQTFDLATAKIKISKYCAYQERAHYEVEQKLYSFGINSDEVGEILAWLITENYVNEERYAIAFAGGKFRIKKWGKIKIMHHLKQKRVSKFSIAKSVATINDDDYLNTLQVLINQKWQSTSADNIYELRNKVARYVIAKGFEPEQVWDLVRTIIT